MIKIAIVVIVLQSYIKFLAVDNLILLFILLISDYESWLVNIQVLRALSSRLLRQLLLLELGYIVK